MVCPRSSITMNLISAGCIVCCFSSLQAMKKNNGCTTKKILKNIYKNKFAFPLELGEKSPDDPYAYILKLKKHCNISLKKDQKIKQNDEWSCISKLEKYSFKDDDDTFSNLLNYHYNSDSDSFSEEPSSSENENLF